MRKITCEHCGLESETKDSRKRFCNRSCSAKYNNRGRRRHGLSPRICLGCEKRNVPTRSKTGYCSHECRQSHEIVRWLAGELDGNYKYTHAGYVRRHLEYRSSNECELCGFNTVKSNGRSILQVDHIDGNWRNNSVENVRLICPNCHALTDNWGAGNMGKGRKWKANYNQYFVPDGELV